MSPYESASSTLDVPSSEELACRAQAGSLPSFAMLVQRHQGRLYNFLLRKLGSEPDAEDVTQETFVRAWQRIDQYRPRWRFSTWLYTIGSRLAINHHRAGARRRRVERPAAGFDRAVTGGADPAEQVSRLEDHENVWSLASRLLTADQLTMLWLRYAEDLSAQEIAGIMARTQVVVRVTLHRAKQRLARAMQDAEQDAGMDSPQNPGRACAAKPLTGGVS